MSKPDIWNADNLALKGSYRHFPSESVLRATVTNSYFTNSIKIQPNMRILDIGSLYANNLVPFADRGCELYGTEVTDESVAISRKHSKIQGIETIIKKGFNTSLPFDDNYFDLLLSISTIHYEENMQNVSDAFKEFKRVTKQSGYVLIRTVAPEHDIFKNSKKIDDGLYQLNMPKDIRHNQIFSFFETEDKFINMLSKHFQNIECSRLTEKYPNAQLDFYMALCSQA